LFEVTADLEAWAALDPSIAKALKSLLPPPGSKELKRLVVIVQPDGDFTYVVSGDDPREMARVVVEARKSEPGAPFVKPARDEKVAFAGFLTLNYVAHSLARSGSGEEFMKALGSAPHHGETPIPFSATTAPGSLRFDLEIPADAMTDSSVAMASGGSALRGALDGSTLR